MEPRSFSAIIRIIGVNPYVPPPRTVLSALFARSGKRKGPIPVQGTIDGHPFVQTLVKYAGRWRLYVNGPMMRATRRTVGERVEVRIDFDPRERTTPMPVALEAALRMNPRASEAFRALPPSRRKEIMRYIGRLKSTAAIERNVARAIGFLEGRERFAGRDAR